MAELIVRKAERGDAEAVAKLEQICFAAPWSEEALIRDMTENEMAAYVVAEYEGQIVGYVGLWIIIDEGTYQQRRRFTAVSETTYRFPTD